MNDFPRITQNPSVMGGKPCIRGLRVTVGMIVGQIGAGIVRAPMACFTRALTALAAALGVTGD